MSNEGIAAQKIFRKCSYLKERLSENEIQCHYFIISGGSDQSFGNEYFPFYVKRGLYSKVSGKNSTVSFEYEKPIRNSLSQFVDQLPRHPFVWRRNQVSVTTFLTAFQDLEWIMVHPEVNVDGGCTRSTGAGRSMIGQSTVTTNRLVLH